MDGGSRDGTLQILEEYAGRLRWTSGPDRGPAGAINRGWQQGSGEYLAWLNADDVWLPGAVSAAVAAFTESPELDLLYGACGAIDTKGRLIWVAPPAAWSLDQAIIGCDTIIHQPAAFMRRQAVEKAGWLYEDWCHDHDLWIRMALAGARFGNTAAHLANLRVWAGDAHSDPELMVPALLRLIDRTFARPDLPQRFEGQLKRTRSFAYLRCLDYLIVTKPSHWVAALGLIANALRTDPSNAGTVAREVASRVPVAARRVRDFASASRRQSTDWGARG